MGSKIDRGRIDVNDSGEMDGFSVHIWTHADASIFLKRTWELMVDNLDVASQRLEVRL